MAGFCEVRRGIGIRNREDNREEEGRGGGGAASGREGGREGGRWGWWGIDRKER